MLLSYDEVLDRIDLLELWLADNMLDTLPERVFEELDNLRWLRDLHYAVEEGFVMLLDDVCFPVTV